MAAVGGVVDVVEDLRSVRGVDVFFGVDIVAVADAVVAAAAGVNVGVDGVMLAMAAKSM